LMGFNEPQSSKFVIPVSDTQAYRQFGNAVVVPVVRAVANLMRLVEPHQSRAFERCQTPRPLPRLLNKNL
ncbi:DNA cytosine methyltransferase, partial [Rhizobium ruizarguesonis]